MTQVEGIKIVFNYYLHPKYTATKIKSFFLCLPKTVYQKNLANPNLWYFMDIQVLKSCTFKTTTHLDQWTSFQVCFVPSQKAESKSHDWGEYTSSCL